MCARGFVRSRLCRALNREAGVNGENLVVELLTSEDKAVKSVRTTNSTAAFYYVRPGKYYGTSVKQITVSLSSFACDLFFALFFGLF